MKEHMMSHGTYKNEVEKPEMAKMGHEGPGMGAEPDPMADNYRNQASDQSYGQAGKSGFMSDDKKIRSQFRPSYDDMGH